MTDRPHKKTTRKVGKRSVAIDGDVSDSAIITGDHNVIQISAPADPVATALHQLRAPVGDFVGREQEIEILINCMRRDSRASITGISGMGGIGKTELALLVARRLSKEYPDAQFFINLQGTDVNPRPPHEVMATCVRAFLGPEARLPEDLDQLSSLYRSQLSGKRVLLLLDNAADSNQVRPLIPPSGSALVVTSRQALTLPGMTPLTLNPLTDAEARRLLLDIAPRIESIADEICRLCGYLPLAIRAAGSLLALTLDLDPTEYATQLKDERNRLERIGTEGVDIGVGASFNLSYDRLPGEEARVFRLLSVFRSTFDPIAAELVCDDTGHAYLSNLARRSLVLYDSTTKRYRLHDLARLFADTKLSAAECAVAQKRHAKHYMKLLSLADQLYQIGGAELVRGLALFDLEWANIQAAHAWVGEQPFELDEEVTRLARDFPGVGAYLLDFRQHPVERIRWLKIALAASRQLKDRAVEGKALGSLGNAYRNLGETQRAIQFYEQYLTISRDLGDRQDEGTTLSNLGNSYTDLEDPQRAIPYYQQALVIHRELGYRRGEANALSNSGNAYLLLGEMQHAIEFYEQALFIYRELGERRGESTALWNLSLVFHQLGKRTEAISYAEASLIIGEEIEDPLATIVRKQLAEWREQEGYGPETTTSSDVLGLPSGPSERKE